MLVRSKAPLRISFSGGGTDVPPYPQTKGGVVLSCTINKYAYASLIPLKDKNGIKVVSLDYERTLECKNEEDLEYNGDLDLVKSVIKNMKIVNKGIEVYLHSDAPPGSGLGSSSTMVVSLIGLFRHWLNIPLTNYDIADLAYKIERVDLGIKGGLQDQYAATFGGFNFIEFIENMVIVNPLKIPDDIVEELNYSLLLCYTGKRRLSANIIQEQVDGVVKKKESVMQAMDELKSITIKMKNALLQGRLNDFGKLLHYAWENKKKMADKISAPFIDEMYRVARKTGALGGKILGAGGGGYLLIFAPFNRRHMIAEELERLGGKIVNFDFEFKGLRTWEIR
jgi:D-glycero-alpha-D-manno-heptose-7-phosphate kinase